MRKKKNYSSTCPMIITLTYRLPKKKGKTEANHRHSFTGESLGYIGFRPQEKQSTEKSLSLHAVYNARKVRDLEMKHKWLGQL